MSRQLMFNRRNVNKVLNGFYLPCGSIFFSYFCFPFNLLFLDSRLSNSQTFNKIVINSEVYVDSALGSSSWCQIIFSFSSENLNMKPMRCQSNKMKQILYHPLLKVEIQQQPLPAVHGLYCQLKPIYIFALPFIDRTRQLRQP